MSTRHKNPVACDHPPFAHTQQQILFLKVNFQITTLYKLARACSPRKLVLPCSGFAT